MIDLSQKSRWRISVRFSLAMVLGMLLLFAVPGCGGCRQEDPVAKKKREEEEAKEKKKKEKEKPKPDFDSTKLITLPFDNSLSSSNLNHSKPGHWVTGSQLARANNFDFQADMVSQLVDLDLKPVDVERTPFQLSLSRPAVLPKGQVKNFEIILPMSRPPRVEEEMKKAIRLKSKLEGTKGGKTIDMPIEQILPMPDHQFFFLVLARDPDNYSFLKRKTMSSIHPPCDDPADPHRLYYRVLLPKLGDNFPVPLPTHPLTWTSLAYLLWDGAFPNKLSPDQQQAMLDWLHWGGQLIISGPDSLDDLRGSFLEPYLPAQKTRVVEYTNNDLKELNDYWSLESKRKKDPQRLTLAKNIPLIGVELKPHPAAEFLPHTGKLAIERRVGAGRIVVSAFSLGDSRVKYWRNFDNFLNNGLMRRPPREFHTTKDGFFSEVGWLNLPQASIYDPRLISTMRYFTRDMGYENELDERKIFDELSPRDNSLPFRGRWDDESLNGKRNRIFGTHPHREDWHFNGYSFTPDSGVAGWNDFSGTAAAVRTSLKDAAGITVPDYRFVFRVLCVYLVVLVPVNWAFFRMIGRLEWAWLAAPVIAIVGAVMVIRMAQLDIGFVRSRTEMAILELQGNYNRGHLTRYTALYTSLSSTYSVTLEGEASLALPFSVEPNYKRTGTARDVTFRRDRNSRLTNFLVDSNSTGMLHSEQVLKPGGEFSLLGNDEDGWQLRNNSDLALSGTGVLRRTMEGQLEQVWLGNVAAHTTVALRFRPLVGKELFFAQWDESPVTGRNQDTKGEVNLSGVISLAADRLYLNRGDIRLIGYADHESQKMADLTISPSIAQTLIRVFVICHLQRGPLPVAISDKNTRVDFEDDAAGVEDDEIAKPPMKDTPATFPEDAP